MDNSRPPIPRCVDPERIVPISRESTLVFRTGTWSKRRPQFAQKPSPCRTLCPNGNNIPKALNRAAQGDWDGALAGFLEESPLPAVCGRVCDHPCQKMCNRSELEGSVSVREVERAAAEFGRSEPQALSDAGRAYPVAVVGAGPAGLAATYHLARMGHPVHLLEAGGEPGGLLVHGIPPFRLPRKSWRRDLDRILGLTARVSLNTQVNAAVFHRLMADHAAVFLALGAQAPRSLGLPGEQLEGVLTGLEFLRRPDLEPLARGARVVIIGGGNTAMDAARVAVRCGARKVLVLYRRSRAEMPAFPDEVQEAEEEGVVLRFNVGPVEFLGREGRVDGVRHGPTRPAGSDGHPQPGGGPQEEISCDLVLLATGQGLGETDLLKGLKTLTGRVWVDGLGRTSLPGILAGGDMTPQRAAVVDALASGKRAAAAIHVSLTGGANPEELLGLTLGEEEAFSLAAWFERSEPFASHTVAPLTKWARLTACRRPPASTPRLSPAQRVQGFDEAAGGLSRDVAQAEACRCFCCGSCVGCDQCYIFCPDAAMLPPGRDRRAYGADPDYCKGCGVCAAVCARGVLTFDEGQ